MLGGISQDKSHLRTKKNKNSNCNLISKLQLNINVIE